MAGDCISGSRSEARVANAPLRRDICSEDGGVRMHDGTNLHGLSDGKSNDYWITIWPQREFPELTFQQLPHKMTTCVAVVVLVGVSVREDPRLSAELRQVQRRLLEVHKSMSLQKTCLKSRTSEAKAKSSIHSSKNL